MERPQLSIMPESLSYKAVIFSTIADLYSLVISCNSGGSPGPDWKFAILNIPFGQRSKSFAG